MEKLAPGPRYMPSLLSFRPIVAAAAMLAASAAGPAAAFVIESRWTATAVDGPVAAVADRGVPVTLTWSIVPDGTSLPGNPSPPAASNFISFLDSLDASWGVTAPGSDFTLRPWFAYLQQSVDRLSALSGVALVYEPADSGAPFAQANAGVLGARGDIRLGGKSFGVGSPTLALTAVPPYGEMMVNTDKQQHYANIFNNYRRLRNTITHELLHSLGLGHVVSSTAQFLAEPIITTAFDGPQLDDVLGLHRLYGDQFEKSGGNDSPAAATALGAVSPAQGAVVGTLGTSTAVALGDVDFVSIDDDSDVDLYRFTLATPLQATLTLTPRGPAYQVGPEEGPEASYHSGAQRNLVLELLASDGATLLAAANAGGVGLGESIVQQLAAGDYYARVSAAGADVQLYQLAVSATAASLAADFNSDGAVDALDLAAWKAGFGAPGGKPAGDATGDGSVDGADYLAWQRQFNSTTPAATAAGAVPEPGASVIFASLALAANCLTRRTVSSRRLSRR